MFFLPKKMKKKNWVANCGNKVDVYGSKFGAKILTALTNSTANAVESFLLHGRLIRKHILPGSPGHPKTEGSRAVRMVGLKQLVRRVFRICSAERRSRGQLQQAEVEETGGAMRSAAAAATSVTLELDVLDCAVCWQALCPPVFQVQIVHSQNQKVFYLFCCYISAAISLWCRYKF